jgi:CRP/FNR family transcriptional regulator, cyclic AMP receptor protein
MGDRVHRLSSLSGRHAGRAAAPGTRTGPDRRPVVFLLDADPALGAGLSRRDATLARRALAARMETITPGREAAMCRQHGRVALVVLSGLLLREVTVAGRTAGELLGAGDVIRPSDASETSTIHSDVRWSVIEPTRAAVIDRRVVATAARWPLVLEALFERAVSRAHAVTLRQASMRLPHLEERILVVLWSLADRWGHVRPDGVILGLPLTHDLLARLVGAGRPAVTRALGRLRERRLLRRDTSGWLLDTSTREGTVGAR